MRGGRFGVGGLSRRPATKPPPTPPNVPGVWGPAVANDGLSNVRVGTPSGELFRAAFVFKAERSGTLSSLRWYLIGGIDPGYSAGTGGKCVIDLCNVDGESKPNTASVIASTTEVTCPTSTASKVSTFASPPSVVAGTRYALVFRNTDADPTSNYYSTDNLLDWSNTPPINHRWSDPRDWKMWWSRNAVSSGAWREINLTPICDITYGDASHQGMGYMEVHGLGGADGHNLADGTNQVRAVITPASTIAVTSILLRCGRTSGSAVLSVRLETSGGAEVETVTAAAALITAHARPASGDRGGNVWLELPLAATRTLTGSSTYHLQCSTTAGTEYWFEASRKGSSYSYSDSTYSPLAVSHMEKYNGSVWSDVLDSSGDAVAYDDLQFAFRTVA